MHQTPTNKVNNGAYPHFLFQFFPSGENQKDKTEWASLILLRIETP